MENDKFNNKKMLDAINKYPSIYHEVYDLISENVIKLTEKINSSKLISDHAGTFKDFTSELAAKIVIIGDDFVETLLNRISESLKQYNQDLDITNPKYCIVARDNLDDLASMVSLKMDQGWMPSGSMISTRISTYNIYGGESYKIEYAQPMIKRPSKIINRPE